MWQRISLVSFIFVLAAPALAVEPGTYRAGQPYQSARVSGPDACMSQCDADGQCQGWNFIRMRGSDTAGICELNAVRVAPVSSPVSMSGDRRAAKQSTRLVSAGARTVRVHSAVAPEPKPAAQGRRVVSQTVPPRYVPQTASDRRERRRNVRSANPPPHQKTRQTYRRTQPFQNSGQPPAASPQAHMGPRLGQNNGFQHMLDGSPQRSVRHSDRPVPPRSAALQSPVYPHAEPRPPRGATTAQPRQPWSQASALAARGPLRQAPAQMAVPAAAPRPAGIPHEAPSEPRSLASTAQPRSGSMQPQTPQRRLSVQAAQQSLYGSLHDDVTVPRMLTEDDLAGDPDAPISTVRSVPVQQVDSSPL